MRGFSIVALSVILNGCATVQPGASGNALSVDWNALPAIAAEFETVISEKDAHAHRSGVVWRMLREPERLETRELSANTGEAWLRTANALLFHRRLYHDDRQVVEYSPVDLNMLDGRQSWEKIALLIDPELLRQLKPDGSEKILGRIAQRYRGTLQGIQYEILWLPLEKVPASVNEISRNGHTRTRLTRLYELAESPWFFTDVSDYRLIEYSDIGDMERDPFVVKILGRIPGTSGHAH